MPKIEMSKLEIWTKLQFSLSSSSSSSSSNIRVFFFFFCFLFPADHHAGEGGSISSWRSNSGRRGGSARPSPVAHAHFQRQTSAHQRRTTNQRRTRRSSALGDTFAGARRPTTHAGERDRGERGRSVRERDADRGERAEERERKEKKKERKLIVMFLYGIFK